MGRNHCGVDAMLQTLRRWLGWQASPPAAEAPALPLPAATAEHSAEQPIEPMDATALAQALEALWLEKIEDRRRDEYDRDVGVLATSHAARIFRRALGNGEATYRRVSHALLEVTWDLDFSDTGNYEYASGKSAVGSALWALLELLREQRPAWLARPNGVPAHVQRWLDGRVDIAPDTCLRAGRSDAERVGFLLRALSAWRSDSTAWQTLRGLHALHDGMFSGAKSSFEEVPGALESALRASALPVTATALQAVLEDIRGRYRRSSPENRDAVGCACDFAEAVLAKCTGPIDPEAALHAARAASLWRAVRANRLPRPEASNER